MSVTQPADSGGTNAFQTLQVDKKMEDINQQIGSWAQLMEEEDEEQYIEVSQDEDEGTDEVDGGGGTGEGEGESSSKSPDKQRKRVPDEAPFRVQVTNISKKHDEEELLYYFGGDQHIKRFTFKSELGRAEFEFHTRDGLVAALERHELEFQNSTLKVFTLRNNVGRVTSRHSNDYNYGSHDSNRHINHHHNHNNNMRRYQNDHRGSSHYNSQSSLNSDKHSNRGYRDNNRYANQNHYGTMPAGGFHDNKRGGFSNRGGFNNYHHNGNDGNSFRAPKNPNYHRQNSGPAPPHHYRGGRYEGGGPIQRSGSYQSQRGNDYRHNQPPQPISSRNRTDSHSTTYDQFSRASSRMSLDEAGAPKPIQRKVSANPFGDAKPVDTSTKLLEIEKRQAEKDRAEKEAATAAAAAAAAKQLAAAGDDGSDEQQHQQPHQQPQQQQNQQHQHGDQHNNSRNSKKSSSSSKKSSHNHEVDRRPSFDQGARPGSVIIKKRESTEVDKQRDDECSTPPVDPYQYPSNPAEGDKPQQHQQNESTTDALPPTPPTQQANPQQRTGSTKNHQQRPSAKTYVPKGGVLQKSATVGQFDNQQHLQQNQTENRNRKDSTGKFNRNYSTNGARRSSFSGSEGGGKPSRNPVPKRGGGSGRGGGNAGHNTSSRDQKNYRGGKSQQQQQHESKKEEVAVKDTTTSPPTAEVAAAPLPQVELPAEPVKVVAVAQNEKETVEKSSSTTTTIQTAATSTPATPTPKKKDKKKDKKKELIHMSTNKYAALMDCPQ